MISESTAEEIKRAIGSACPPGHEEAIDVRGRDAVTGLPKILTVRSTEVHRALWKSVHTILDSIQTTLEKSPPELVADTTLLSKMTAPVAKPTGCRWPPRRTVKTFLVWITWANIYEA